MTMKAQRTGIILVVAEVIVPLLLRSGLLQTNLYTPEQGHSEKVPGVKFRKKSVTGMARTPPSNSRLSPR